MSTVNSTELYCNICSTYKNWRYFSYANHYKLKDERQCKECTKKTKISKKYLWYKRSILLRGA